MLLNRASRSSARLLSSRTPLRVPRPSRRYDSSASSPPSTAGGASSGVLGGIIGGAVVLVGGYTVYHFSGAKSSVDTISATKKQVEQAIKSSAESVPEPDQAIKWLRDTASSYVGIIPGAKQYVDTTFDELESLKKEHGSEVDKIVKETYDELKKIGNEEGLTMQGLTKVWDTLQTTAKKIKDLAGDVGADIMNKNPELKQKFGQKFEDLQNMADQYGPEAKKEVDDAWKQVQDILKGGFGAGSLDKILKLLEEKIQEIKKMGDQAWDKGLEQAKPYLDKNPKVKEFVEKNKDKLKSANLDELWKNVQEAAKTGKTENLEKFAKEKASQAKKSFDGQSLEEYLKLIPGGEEISGKFQQLQKLGEKHGKEAEQLMKEAFEEVKSVLETKVDEGQKLAEKAAKDAK